MHFSLKLRTDNNIASGVHNCTGVVHGSTLSTSTDGFIGIDGKGRKNMGGEEKMGGKEERMK